MPIDWNEVNQALSPIKNYESLCQRLHGSFAYPFVRETYNFTLPELVHYTQKLLGGDARGRYTEYAAILVRTIERFQQSGVLNVLDLVARIDTPEQFEAFTRQSGVGVREIAAVLKYLIFWFIPMEKALGGLVGDEPLIREALKVLRGLGIRTNLDLLQQGISAARRQAIADSSGLPAPAVLDLVNRADFSRLPWASKATISNIIGAGYGSLAQLASADPEQLYADFFRYGASIGKNLKLGNEIESSYRIARILPAVLQED